MASSEENDVQFEECDQALLNDVVSAHLFRYLRIYDLKNYRRVCKRWLLKVEPTFRKRTRVLFGYSFPKEGHNNSENIKNVGAIFERMSREIPLNAVAFTSLSLIPWKEEELKEFFSTQGSQISDLKFDGVEMKNAGGEHFLNYNIVDLLRENTYQNLTSLNISSSFISKTRFAVPLHKFPKIKQLFLNNCDILLEEGAKISPVKLTFKILKCFKAGQLMDTSKAVTLNDFINFDNVKALYIERSFSKTDQLFSIDMQSSRKIHLKSVELNGTEIVDWENANWTIDTLTILKELEFTRRNTKMKVRKIVISRSNKIEHIQFLPPSIEDLDMEFTYGKVLRELDPELYFFVNFPLLHTVKISLDQVAVLERFANCPNLTVLEIQDSFNGHELGIKMSWIPRMLKKLKLHAFFHFDEYPPGVCELDILVLTLCDFRDKKLESLINSFHPKVIAIEGWPTNNNSVVYESARNSDAYQKNCFFNLVLNEYPNEKIWIGPFSWEEGEFQSSVISPYVSREGKYYSFHNRAGVTVSEYEFQKRSNF